MAGLLSWAAEVAGLEEDASDVDVSKLHFKAEQLEEIDTLDRRASALEQDLQQLRQRFPGQSLPCLHADSLASQSALALELHAHSATRLQAQLRESSLRCENEAYLKALSTSEEQAVERSREAQQLEVHLQELENTELELRRELDQLENVLQDKERNLEGVQMEDKHCLQDIPLENVDETPVLKAELAKWQLKNAEARKELALIETTALSAQREKDLQRRLRVVGEHLNAKLAQAERLVIERDVLELQVEKAGRSQKHVSKEETNPSEWRSKLSRRSLQRRWRNGGTFASAAQLSLSFRACLIVYVFGLHIVVLVILSHSRIQNPTYEQRVNNTRLLVGR